MKLRLARARDWLADHIAVMVWTLLALWAPPIAFTVLVDLKLVAGAGSGYLSLRDPGLLLSIMQVVLMAAALPVMRPHPARAKPLLVAALGVWIAHTAWTWQLRLRLLGRADLVSAETLVTLAALAAASGVLLAVRDQRRVVATPIESVTTSPQPAVPRPGTT